MSICSHTMTWLPASTARMPLQAGRTSYNHPIVVMVRALLHARPCLRAPRAWDPRTSA
ncbi:hypothetical protein C8T65DRAFT_654909 [Cerioporus squamosus]|nr:hypothetical protein C8T65DRAFT_654909 [Cerioporus squamosus]